MTDPSQSVTEAASTPKQAPVVRRRTWFGTFVRWMLVVFLLMQLIMWSMAEPVIGPWLFNTITYAQIFVSGVCLLIWWFLFAPYSRRTIWSVGGPIVLLLIGWGASIRDIDPTGDMEMNIQYRWEKSSQEKFEEYRETQEAEPVPQITTTIQISPDDVPGYRGVDRDGVVPSPPLRTNWEMHPPTELWRHPIGGGYSSFAIVAPLIVTMEQRGDDEAVVAYDVDTGQELWEHRYRAHFDALGGPGPRSTPTIHHQHVYAYGCYGDLFCLNALTGEPIWHVNVLQQFGLPTTHWGMTASPLIHDEKVIVTTGGLKDEQAGRTEQLTNGIVAYHLATGELVWHSSGIAVADPDRSEFQTGQAAIDGISGKTLPGYSSPMLVELAGQPVILNFDGTALHGHDPESGQLLWDSYPFLAGDYINVAQPILLPGDQLLISSGYGTGSMRLQVTFDEETGNWECKPQWDEPSTRLRCKFSSPVYFDGYVYGLDEGRMVCFDPNTGERLWNGRREGLRGRYGHGQMLLADNHIIVLTESGELVLIEPSPQELIVKGIHQVLSDDVKTWNPLAMAYGKAFVRNASEVACFDLRANTDFEKEVATLSDSSSTVDATSTDAIETINATPATDANEDRGRIE